MCTAAVVDGDDTPVALGDLVGAHPEGRLERTCERDEEPTAATRCRCLLRHRLIGTAVAGLPAVCGVEPPDTGQHPRASEAEFEGHRLDLRVVGQQVRGHETGIVGRGRQHIAGAEVTRTYPLAPGHPRGREQRALAGEQDDLVHGRGEALDPTDRDRPVPALVAAEAGLEGVGDQPLTGGPHPQVIAEQARLQDGGVIAGGLQRGGSGKLDGGGTLGVRGRGVEVRSGRALL